MYHHIVRSDDVIGVAVENPEGENLGKIEELLINKESGQVEWIVLSFGGFLGMGDKWFPMPWRMFSYNTNREKFVINVDKEKLKNSPGFDKNNWPDMKVSGWDSSFSRYYGH